MEIQPRNIQGTLHPRFQKSGKLITSETPDQAELEALVDRLTRRAEEIARMDAKIVMSLETEEDIH